MDAKMDAGQLAEGALSSRGNRYFVNDMYRYSNRLWQFIFSDLMAEVCKATIGDAAYLFHEQWVVKGPERHEVFLASGLRLREAYDPDTQHQP